MPGARYCADMRPVPASAQPQARRRPAADAQSLLLTTAFDRYALRPTLLFFADISF